jgi:hypothetical protein
MHPKAYHQNARLGKRSFRSFLKSLRDDASPMGDFAGDALGDRQFPAVRSLDHLDSYLRTRNACSEALAAAAEAWGLFQSQINSGHCCC